MARNLPVTFAAVIAGGVLLDAAIKGAAIGDVIKGQAQPSSASSSSASNSPLAGVSSSGAANPFAKASSLAVGRTDQGVDFNLAPGDPILAPFAGTVTAINQGWYNGQPQLVIAGAPGSSFAGKFLYLAEGIIPNVSVGDTVSAGEQIATFHQYGNGGEIGWAADQTGTTLARTQGGYTEGHPTEAGSSFRSFLGSLGVPV